MLVAFALRVSGHFDTPYHARHPVAHRRKWETYQGMCPLSYEYSAATSREAHLDANGIARSLEDVVGKDGPTAEGRVVDGERVRLREAGGLKYRAWGGIFGTRYWCVTAQVGEDVRATRTEKVFYICVLRTAENGVLEIVSPVPRVEGGEVTVACGS